MYAYATIGAEIFFTRLAIQADVSSWPSCM
jgi:hypothetical protein